MAKKTEGPTYRDIINDIKRGKLAPVYILMGEEPYYIDLIAESLENNVITEEDKYFNCEVFYGSDADINAVVGTAQQFPVMAERKLVMLKEAQSMFRAKNQLDKLAPYIQKPNQSTVLVVVYKGDSLTASSAIMKAASSGGAVIFKSAAVKDYKLTGPLRDYCSAIDVAIDDKAASILCEYIGNPLTKLFGEVDKLKVAIGERKRITAQDIEDNIGISKDFNNLELKDALASKNYPKALMITRYFRKNPKQNPVVVTTAILFDFFVKLCIALFSPDKSDSALVSVLDLKNSYGVKEIRTAMSFYNASQAVKAIHAIRNFDAKSKGIGSSDNPYDLLDELVFTILT